MKAEEHYRSGPSKSQARAKPRRLPGEEERVRIENLRVYQKAPEQQSIASSGIAMSGSSQPDHRHLRDGIDHSHSLGLSHVGPCRVVHRFQKRTTTSFRFFGSIMTSTVDPDWHAPTSRSETTSCMCT